MDFDSRIGSFIKLGKRLRESGKGLFQDPLDVMEQAIAKAIASNPWFTGSAVRYALQSLGDALVEENIHRWLEPYKDRINRQTGLKTVAVVMAGNIPAVGFHDLLSVLITGQRLQARLSSSDEHLLPAMAHILQAEDKGWTERILFSGKIQRPFDAVIATGNDNSARHFTEYFGQYPHIIRKNRTSVAVLKGDETLHQLTSLAAEKGRNKMQTAHIQALPRKQQRRENAVQSAGKQGNDLRRRTHARLLRQPPFQRKRQPVPVFHGIRAEPCLLCY